MQVLCKLFFRTAFDSIYSVVGPSNEKVYVYQTDIRYSLNLMAVFVCLFSLHTSSEDLVSFSQFLSLY